jgi:hypothetical protein
MGYQFNKHRTTLVILLLALFFIIACGTAATPASESGDAAPQTEPTTAPAVLVTQAPQGAAPTAVPQQTPESPQATEPAGTLNIGQKELGPFMGHPRLAGNPKSSLILPRVSLRPC